MKYSLSPVLLFHLSVTKIGHRGGPPLTNFFKMFDQSHTVPDPDPELWSYKYIPCALLLGESGSHFAKARMYSKEI